MKKIDAARAMAKSIGLRDLWQNPNPDAKFVYASDGRRRGRLTGGERLCNLEGCKGVRLRVRWPNGKTTWPCTVGMFVTDDGQWCITPVKSPKKDS